MTGSSEEAEEAAAMGLRPGTGLLVAFSVEAKSVPGLRSGTGGCQLAAGVTGFLPGSGVNRGSAAIVQHLLDIMSARLV